MIRTAVICVALLVITLPEGAKADNGRISGATVHEVRGGKVPFEDSTNVATSYNQVNVSYLYGDLEAGLRAEVYRTSTDNRSVTYLSQKYLRWTHGPAEILAGNYFGILGRGLTLRAFESAGVILESTSYRRRYAPSQDLEGGMATWSQGFVSARALVGRPVESEIPPDAPGVDRRTDWVTGGEATLQPHRALRLGATAVNLRPKNTSNSWAWSWLAGLDLTDAFMAAGLETVYGEIYGEFAQRAQHASDGHARYVSANFGIGAAGLSVEYKDYDNFVLGVNDPPQLVREHSSYLLNRATHVAEPFKEEGWQVEGYVPVLDGVTVTGNVSQSKNALAPTRTLHFDERFFQVDIDRLGEGRTLQTYFGWGRDEIDGRSAMRTGGLLIGTSTASGNRFELNAELQRGKLAFGANPWYWDSYGALSWQSPLGFGVSLVMDRTTDLLETDNPDTFTELETDPLSYWSVNANASYGRFDALLFAGERRGGTACTSGTCYQVLPFRGVELRLSTRI